jgi:hypothetical protein
MTQKKGDPKGRRIQWLLSNRYLDGTDQPGIKILCANRPQDIL